MLSAFRAPTRLARASDTMAKSYSRLPHVGLQGPTKTPVASLAQRRSSGSMSQSARMTRGQARLPTHVCRASSSTMLSPVAPMLPTM